MSVELEGPKKVHERGPLGLTTLVLIDGSDPSLDSPDGFTSIAGIDPIAPKGLLKLYIADSARTREAFERVVTFVLHEDGYHADIAGWTLESPEDEFEPCAVGYWIAANRDGVPADELQAVMDLLPGQVYAGGGGGGASWKVRRAG